MSDVFDEFGVPKHRGHKKRSGWFALCIVALVVVIITAAAVITVPMVTGGTKIVSDYEGTGSGSVTVTVPDGATGTEIANILSDEGVVATPGAFIKAFNADGRSSSIQPGTYTLKKKMSASAAISALLDPANVATIKVVIPEGFTQWQLSARLAKKFGVEESAVKKAMADTDAIGLPAEANGKIEGWVAPATYTFEPDTTVTEALKTMIAKRVNALKSQGVAQDQWESVLIKASIVEREVATQDEYAKVARVIENRLSDTTGEVAGRLQMDSTVLYGAGKTGGVPTAAELKADTAYNTYVHAGLPPTPIGMPGEAAIAAVLAPARGDWLYFTTVNLTTGETKFTADYAEQQKFQQEFRDWLKANPDAVSSGS
ncbi:endolytic transglycosylase MltG [Neoactinobaculum massilliense]|uniref:endolytic transglycosylase MltG n=1 Tax=Neoactinobaculum massilliense TaxID=2364794 RepID=UPI000F53D7CF|nr:endolytic transglycosylase MltG [Neoactinobaculum massilliense]